jgi:type IV secretion system protein VirB9
MMKFLLFIVTVSICCCTTVDVDKSVRNASERGRPQTIDDLPVSIPIEPEIVIRERPVFVPEKEFPRPHQSGTSAVQESNNTGIAKPSDYSHAAMVYDYDPDWVYEIYAQPLRACDIVLEPGENVLEAPFVSDSVRWQLGAGVSYERGIPVQHIYVKPSESGIEASLIVNTDRRVYHIILRSYKTVHMPITRWRYYTVTMPNNVISTPKNDPESSAGAPAGADPRYLSFNYKITYSWFRKPRWLPKLVFDDGTKTYITFPESVLNRELPAVFENRKDVVNYRVIDNLIVIDQLVDAITVKIQKTEISIEKKQANGR